MTEPMLVSIVITYYDHAAYLRQAVASALAQTYPRLEIIVVDDCSPALPAEKLLDEFRGRVRILRHAENQGPAAATNTGIRQSAGTCFVVLDSDDWIEPDFLQGTVAILEQAGCAGVYTQVRVFGERDFLHVPELSVLGIMAGQPGPTTFLCRRTVYDALGGYKPHLYHHDNEFWLSALARGFTFERLDRPLYHRRLHAHGRSRRQRAEELPSLAREHRQLYVAHLETVLQVLEKRYWQTAEEYLLLQQRYQELVAVHQFLKERSPFVRSLINLLRPMIPAWIRAGWRRRLGRRSSALAVAPRNES